MNLAQTVLTTLGDGRFHSGEALGQASGRSRSAIWKTIQSLQQAGIEVFSVRGKGYRLASPVELLDAETILAHMAPNTRATVQRLEVCFEVDSTNARLLERARQLPATGHVCLAERQLAGRGRRGREWISPLGGNIYLSLLWQFDGASQLGGLSLAVAVALMRALKEFGLHGAGVKWPNDIQVSGRKLAGILLEVAGEASGPCSVVVGVGLNVNLPADAMTAVEQPWTDVQAELGGPVPRNLLAAKLLHHLTSAIQQFEYEGLSPFLHEWREWDVLADRKVVVDLPQGKIHGIARGVDAGGALLLACDGELRRYHSGEVSVRSQTTVPEAVS